METPPVWEELERPLVDDVTRLAPGPFLSQQVPPPRLQAVGVARDLLLELDILLVLQELLDVLAERGGRRLGGSRSSSHDCLVLLLAEVMGWIFERCLWADPALRRVPEAIHGFLPRTSFLRL